MLVWGGCCCFGFLVLGLIVPGLVLVYGDGCCCGCRGGWGGVGCVLLGVGLLFENCIVDASIFEMDPVGFVLSNFVCSGFCVSSF